MNSNINLVTDVMAYTGNVTFQIFRRNKIIKEFTNHNNVTDEGKIALLGSLVARRTPTIEAIRIVYVDPLNNSIDRYEQFDAFSSRKVITGTEVYAEFKYYLSSDLMNGLTLKGAQLVCKDSVGNFVNFAEVTMNSVLSDKYDELGNPEKVLDSTPIVKDEEISIMYIWRLGISSQFVQAIS